MVSHMYVFVCMCLYVCRPGYVLVCLYITGSQLEGKELMIQYELLREQMVELENTEREEERYHRQRI